MLVPLRELLGGGDGDRDKMEAKMEAKTGR